MHAAPSLANPRRGAFACVLALAALAAAGCQSVWEPGVQVRLLDATTAAQHDWPVSAPAAQGMDEQRLALLRLQLAQHAPAIRSVLIARHGALVFEHYGAGFGPDDVQRVNSITKSVVSALVGIALDQGRLAGLGQPIADTLPEARSEAADARVASITVRDLLTMTAGFEWDEGASDACVGSTQPACARFRIRGDRVRHALRRPLRHAPGQVFGYDSHASHLLSVMLARTTGMSTASFAEQHLFGPLGVPHYRWDTDGRGHALGGAGLYLRPRDVAKLGQLFLDQGVWRGRQLVSRGYVAQATTPQTAGGWPLGVGYGYHWWTAPIQGLPAFSASGYGGQWIRVIPALGMVVVITADDAAATPTRWILYEYAMPAAR